MPLHLAHHKSYHPYNKDNIEKVRRDEEAARLEEESKGERSLLAESESRLEALRRQKAKHVTDNESRLRAAEKELDGRKGALKDFDEKQREKIGLEAGPSRLRANGDTLVDRDGHINFWAGQEGLRKRQRSGGEDASADKRRGNKDYESDKADEKKKWDERTTMYLGKPAKELRPWYQSEDLQSGEEKKKSHEQKLEAA